MSDRKLEVIALLSKDRRFAELTASFNGLNLKQRFPGLSRNDQAEVVRAARRLVQVWQTEDADLSGIPAANADPTEEPTAPATAAPPDITDSSVPESNVTPIERQRRNNDAPTATPATKTWTNVISGSDPTAAGPSVATLALLGLALLLAGGLYLYSQREPDVSEPTLVQGQVDDTASNAQNPATEATPPSSTSGDGASSRSDRVEAIIARHRDKLNRDGENAGSPPPEPIGAATGAESNTAPMASAVAPVGSSDTIATIESPTPETEVEPPQPVDTLGSTEQPVPEPSDPVASGDTLAESATVPETILVGVESTQVSGEDAQTSSDETVLEVADAAAAPETEPAAESTLGLTDSASDAAQASIAETAAEPENRVRAEPVAPAEVTVSEPEVLELTVIEAVSEPAAPAETESTAIEAPVVTEVTPTAVANPVPKFDPKPDRGLLLRIQTHLKLLGFDPGPIDGIMGQQTYDAIRQFQQAKGMRVDGRPTEILLAALISYKSL